MSSHTAVEGCNPAMPLRDFFTYSSDETCGAADETSISTRTTSSSWSQEGERTGAEEASARTSRFSLVSSFKERGTHLCLDRRGPPLPGIEVRRSRSWGKITGVAFAGMARPPGLGSVRRAFVVVRRNRTAPMPATTGACAVTETVMVVLSASVTARDTLATKPTVRDFLSGGALFANGLL